MLVVAHEMALARRISSNVIFMENGSIVEQGTPEKLFNRPEQQRTEEFLRRYHGEE